MQTFLPYPDFDLSAACLDYKRLGKQRVEAKQILNALQYKTGWTKHPATQMWKGYTDALKAYHNAMVAEWVRRGYNNTMPYLPVETGYSLPSWFGNEQFHASHRSNLLRKYPEFYGSFGWSEPQNLPYYWPKEKTYEQD